MSKKHKVTPEALTINETAQALGVSSRKVCELAGQGELKYVGEKINKESVINLVRRNVIGK